MSGAVTVMAQSEISISIRVRFRWWVYPFLAAAIVAALPFAPFMGDRDIAAYSARIVSFVAERGLKVRVV